jgi:general secretion pathway protein C
MADEQPPSDNQNLDQTSAGIGSPRRSRLGGFGEKLSQSTLLQRMRSADPSAMGEWFQSRFQKRGTAFYGKLLTLALCTWFLSDVASVLIRGLLPEPRPVSSRSRFDSPRRQKSEADYQSIYARNLFNSDGKIPGEAGPSGPVDGNPVRTTLPFQLIGTLILQNTAKSIATIEDRTGAIVYPVRVDDEIPAKARIRKIEARKVVFVNLANNALEYVDLPEDIDPAGPKIVVGGPAGGPGIEQLSSTQFNVSRNEVDKALANLNDVLTQARAVPNFENGQPAGYKLFQIVPGSIYAKLGLRDGDVINSLNGEPINDPGKAFAMLSALKEMNHLELGVKRDGRQSGFSYDIR